MLLGVVRPYSGPPFIFWKWKGLVLNNRREIDKDPILRGVGIPVLIPCPLTLTYWRKPCLTHWLSRAKLSKSTPHFWLFCSQNQAIPIFNLWTNTKILSLFLSGHLNSQLCTSQCRGTMIDRLSTATVPFQVCTHMDCDGEHGELVIQHFQTVWNLWGVITALMEGEGIVGPIQEHSIMPGSHHSISGCLDWALELATLGRDENVGKYFNEN